VACRRSTSGAGRKTAARRLELALSTQCRQRPERIGCRKAVGGLGGGGTRALGGSQLLFASVPLTGACSSQITCLIEAMNPSRARHATTATAPLIVARRLPVLKTGSDEGPRGSKRADGWEASPCSSIGSGLPQWNAVGQPPLAALSFCAGEVAARQRGPRRFPIAGAEACRVSLPAGELPSARGTPELVDLTVGPETLVESPPHG